MVLLFDLAPEHHAAVLSSGSKSREAVMSLAGEVGGGGDTCVR